MIKRAWTERRSWSGYFIVIFLLHAAGITGLMMNGGDDNATYLGLGLLAYTLGLRHAFDIDHIAAIDNTVRKLVQEKKNALGVGFYFALGHSTVVLLMVITVTFSVNWMKDEMPQVLAVGGIIGSTVLGMFLVLIGLFNLIILFNLFRVYRKMRRGHNHEELNNLMESRGFIIRLITPMFRFINKSWHIYPLGFLFGLGFDTATEVALLSISAGAAHSSVHITGILALPLLFAAGMCLMDTTDGMFMTKAYKWSFSSPVRKLYYNMTVTTISVAAALTIGVVQLLQLLSETTESQAAFFKWIDQIDFGNSGYGLVTLFLGAWIISIIVWKIIKNKNRIDIQDA